MAKTHLFFISLRLKKWGYPVSEWKRNMFFLFCTWFFVSLQGKDIGLIWKHQIWIYSAKLTHLTTLESFEWKNCRKCAKNCAKTLSRNCRWTQAIWPQVWVWWSWRWHSIMSTTHPKTASFGMWAIKHTDIKYSPEGATSSAPTANCTASCHSHHPKRASTTHSLVGMRQTPSLQH